MGCWEETCAITSQPIYSGDSCIMVIVRGFDLLMPLNNPVYEADCIHSIHKGEYNDYGWIEGLERKEEDVIFFHESAWDKAIECMDNSKLSQADLEHSIKMNYAKDNTRLVVENVPDYNELSLKEFEQRLIECKPNPEIKMYPEHIVDFFKVSNFCYFTRRSIFGSCGFSGGQDRRDADEFREAIFVLQRDLQDKIYERWK
jgi:hypothetical protein